MKGNRRSTNVRDSAGLGVVIDPTASRLTLCMSQGYAQARLRLPLGSQSSRVHEDR